MRINLRVKRLEDGRYNGFAIAFLPFRMFYQLLKTVNFYEVYKLSIIADSDLKDIYEKRYRIVRNDEWVGNGLLSIFNDYLN